MLIRGFMQTHRSTPKKCTMKMEKEEEKNKMMTHEAFKNNLMKGVLYKALSVKWLDGSQ